MFAEVTVIVDGALEETAIFYDYAVQAAWMEDLKADAMDHGYPTEVFVVEHDHAVTVEECVCVQYRTDHKPVWSHNVR